MGAYKEPRARGAARKSTAEDQAPRRNDGAQSAALAPIAGGGREIRIFPLEKGESRGGEPSSYLR